MSDSFFPLILLTVVTSALLIGLSNVVLNGVKRRIHECKDL